jgi:tRNA A37 threonylcarbamoyladenosine biosynthesis protein TsaE
MHVLQVDNNKLFKAQPPKSKVKDEEWSDVQRWAIQLGADMRQQILYLTGIAGCGKTQVALKICEHFAGRLQVNTLIYLPSLI